MFKQKIEVQERRVVALGDAANEGDPRLDAPSQITAQIDKLTEDARGIFTNGIHKRPFDKRDEEQEIIISNRPEVQDAWKSRLDEVAADTEFLQDKSRKAAKQCDETEAETRQLQARWAKAREIHFQVPPPPPVERSLWERLLRALRAMSVQAFFVRYEIKDPIERVVEMDQLLGAPEPNNLALEQNLTSVRDALEKCVSMLDDVNQMSAPNSAGADQNAL